MAFTIQELIKNKVKFEDLIPEYQKNIKDLHVKMSKVREKYGKVMNVTSGFRSRDDHFRIYRELAQKRGQFFDETKIPMGSKHLYCQAVDISDPDGLLFDWCKANEALLAEIGLWCEEKDDQKRVHFQSVPYGSWREGKSRFFNP